MRLEYLVLLENAYSAQRMIRLQDQVLRGSHCPNLGQLKDNNRLGATEYIKAPSPHIDENTYVDK